MLWSGGKGLAIGRWWLTWDGVLHGLCPCKILERDFCFAFFSSVGVASRFSHFPVAWTSHSMALGVGRIGGQCLTLSWGIAGI